MQDQARKAAYRLSFHGTLSSCFGFVLLHFSVYFMCVSVLSLQHMRALYLWGPEESIGFPGIEVTVMEVL